eukprot:gene23151-30356_t
MKNRKKLDLHEEWTTEVFDKMQDRLQPRVNARTAKDVEQRLKGHMDLYVHTVNTKIGVFRDVIDEADYNPLAVQDEVIKIPTGDIRDPVKRDVLKPYYEAQMVSNSNGSLVPSMGKTTTKDTLDVLCWDTGKIEATPYGHCVDSTGEYIVKPVSLSTTKGRSSRIPMDHYNFPMDPAVAQEEMGPIGKAAGESSSSHAVGGAQPSLVSLAETDGAQPSLASGNTGRDRWLEHRGKPKPGVTGGDRWLEHRGKPKVPGPDETRGNRGMREVVQQTTNPYVDGTRGGDRWMEAKGKACPPGPEQRRGRRDLREVVQQSSNPYVDGRTIGDSWLEAKGKRSLSGPPDGARELVCRIPGGPPEAPHKGKLPNPMAFSSNIVTENRTLTTRRPASYRGPMLHERSDSMVQSARPHSTR